MKLDPGIHIAMHSVLSLKPGVTHAASPDPSLARNGSRVADRVRRASDRGGPAAQAVSA